MTDRLQAARSDYIEWLLSVVEAADELARTIEPALGKNREQKRALAAYRRAREVTEEDE